MQPCHQSKGGLEVKCAFSDFPPAPEEHANHVQSLEYQQVQCIEEGNLIIELELDHTCAIMWVALVDIGCWTLQVLVDM
ncbi:hypothetical protein PABG_12384 [Paracoccidioides brasiliensis Pb03]|nr:hypothetical protein PABG_12384 [Paracoccidioides brasiliensis Pb03]